MNIKEEIIIKELKEKYFKRTGRKIEEYGYCTIASEIKEIEPEYLENEELYKKLDYLHSIVINNIGQHLIKRKETYDTVGELNIYNCYSDNHTWNKLTIARKLYEKQEGIWIANHYTIVETYEELEKYHERYWEREPTSVLEQPL
ncbi:hypothetical protein C2G38_2155533 [Gigaspora rosea]|uniref:Uncharacterized protein n=1 Tax=Gigaspora rosea TaxID=44941 RepID=A0A397W3W8_9GLOM|nr:hypothetical protein C2G38_2155533 [Gigaspora rosea]